MDSSKKNVVNTNDQVIEVCAIEDQYASDELDSSDLDYLDKHLLAAARMNAERECEEEEGEGKLKWGGKMEKRIGKLALTSKTLN